MSARVTTAVRLGFAAGLALTIASAAFGTLATDQAAGGEAKAANNQAPAKPMDAAAIASKGRELFGNWSCGSCHSLEDAGATGHVGPAFDGDANLTVPFVVDRVTNGQGPMPAFGGQLTDEEINILAQYLVQVHKK